MKSLSLFAIPLIFIFAAAAYGEISNDIEQQAMDFSPGSGGIMRGGSTFKITIETKETKTYIQYIRTNGSGTNQEIMCLLQLPDYPYNHSQYIDWYRRKRETGHATGTIYIKKIQKVKDTATMGMPDDKMLSNLAIPWDEIKSINIECIDNNRKHRKH